jgi:hypothetical protein
MDSFFMLVAAAQGDSQLASNYGLHQEKHEIGMHA